MTNKIMGATMSVMQEILDGLHDSTLDLLEVAIKNRQRAIGIPQPPKGFDSESDDFLRSSVVKFTKGDPVRINHRARPIYLQGLEGIVEKVRTSRILVKFTGASLASVAGRRFERGVVAYPEHLDKIAKV
jgi:hypothetical protein